MLKLKLQYFGYLMQRTDSVKDPDVGNDWRQEEKTLWGWTQQTNIQISILFTCWSPFWPSVFFCIVVECACVCAKSSPVGGWGEEDRWFVGILPGPVLDAPSMETHLTPWPPCEVCTFQKQGVWGSKRVSRLPKTWSFEPGPDTQTFAINTAPTDYSHLQSFFSWTTRNSPGSKYMPVR